MTHHYPGDGCGYEHVDVTPLDHDTKTHGPVLVPGRPLLPEGSEVSVLRIEPGDRLAVHIPSSALGDSPSVTVPTALDAIRNTVARWAGLAPEAVALIEDGFELSVLRVDEGEDGEVG